MKGQIVDIHHKRIFPGEIVIEKGKIKQIKPLAEAPEVYILPGFVDAHVHIESSMLTPENFSYLVAPQGTVAVVTDPHEIANVLGEEGIQFMQENAKKAIVKCFFTIPSCVPATPFDSAGAELKAKDVERLAKTGEFVGLSEMMNIPGVLQKDPEVMQKITIAKTFNLPIDGHAPLLRGEDLKKYVQAGISTDHESMLLEEGEEKANLGMHILIREGSAARNYDALHPLLDKKPASVMFCTDDAHPDDILERGHINKLVKQAVKDGHELFSVLRASSLHPVNHYRLPVGLLREGDEADFIVVKDLINFEILRTYVKGACVYEKERYNVRKPIEKLCLNNFNHSFIEIASLQKKVKEPLKAIQLLPNELVTEAYTYIPTVAKDNLESDLGEDLLKIVYLNRYHNGKPQVAYIRGVGLKKGALASSIGHDSHNVVAVGVSDKALVKAINEVIMHKGGLAVATEEEVTSLPLPIAGIMSDKTGEEVAERYKALNKIAQTLGTNLKAPFMTLAFMSLIVIPQLKIGEKGLFDYRKFAFI